MASKYKITGFARLLIFLIFFAPIAYIGASYYNGEDGIQKIKDLIGITDEKKSTTAETAEINDLSKDQLIRMKDHEIRELRSQNQKLQRALAECEN